MTFVCLIVINVIILCNPCAINLRKDDGLLKKKSCTDFITRVFNLVVHFFLRIIQTACI